MRDEFGPVLASVHKICTQFEGGATAILDLFLAEDGDKPRSKATLCADLNPNPTSSGKLKARDMYRLMKIAHNFEPLRVMAAMCGFSLVSMNGEKPDAPTVEAEMLQDYPALVEFHKACQEHIEGRIDLVTLDAKEDAAISDIRQTFAKAVEKAQ